MIYTVVVKGAPPPDLARKIAQAHAAALQAAKAKNVRPTGEAALHVRRVAAQGAKQMVRVYRNRSKPWAATQ